MNAFQAGFHFREKHERPTLATRRLVLEMGLHWFHTVCMEIGSPRKTLGQRLVERQKSMPIANVASSEALLWRRIWMASREDLEACLGYRLLRVRYCDQVLALFTHPVQDGTNGTEGIV